jgi:hypothetical protein
MDLKPDGLCVYETTKQDSIQFQCIFNIDSLFYYISNFLNKKESKVICKREFEIILLQTQSLSIK